MRAPLPEIDKVNKVNKVRSHRPSQPRHCSHMTDWTRGFWASQPQRTTLASAGIWHWTHHLHHPQLSEAPPTPSCVLVSDGGSQTTCAPAERSALCLLGITGKPIREFPLPTLSPTPQTSPLSQFSSHNNTLIVTWLGLEIVVPSLAPPAPRVTL